MAPLSPPDFLEFSATTPLNCLITDEGSSLTSSLAQALAQHGCSVTVLSSHHGNTVSDSRFPSSVRHICLADLQESTLQTAIQSVLAQKAVDGVFYLTPAQAPQNFLQVANHDLEIQRVHEAFFVAKHLKQSLCERSEATRPFFITVTRMDGQLGTSGNHSVFQGGLLGLNKTLALEWDSVFCRSIDIASEIADSVAVTQILSEAHDPNCQIREVGYSSQGRVTLVPQKLEELEHVNSVDGISSSTVFLVSGGARGVTADCVIEVAERFQCKFILLGRSKLESSDPAWAQGLESVADLKKSLFQDMRTQGKMMLPKEVNSAISSISSSRAIRATLEKITAAGASVEYVQGDVTQKGVKPAVAGAVSRLGAITGIIHGAGVLADKAIEKKTQAELQRVFSTKIDGIYNLLDAVDPEQLRFMLLFSSASGFYGNTGQSDYAAANEILNKMAYQFSTNYKQCQVVSYNWGPWDGGMVTPELKRMFESKNIQLIPLHEGTDIFVDALIPERKSHPQLLVGSPMPPAEAQWNSELRSQRVHFNVSLHNNSFLQDHCIAGNPVLPIACVLSQMIHCCEGSYEGLFVNECTDFQVYKGIVFEGQTDIQYWMDFQECSKSEQDGLDVEVRVISQDASQKITPHYAARILLKNTVPQTSAHSFDAQETSAFAGSEFYKNGTLFHGHSFQGILKQLRYSDKELLLECQLPELGDKKMQQFSKEPVNALAVDLAFQAMLVWARKHYDCGSLPLKLNKLQNFATIPSGKTFYISLDVSSADKRILQGTLTLHDAQGNVYTQLTGAEVTVSSSLNALFE